MSRLAIAGASLVLVAIAALPQTSPRSGVQLVAARGALAMLNSNPGTAILDVPRIAPGQSASGTVTIGNSGRAPAHLYLESGQPTASPGPNGGSLVERLELTIAREDGGVVARGTLATTAGCHDLGMARAAEVRTYRFTASLPDGGSPPSSTTGDNAYAGSSASVDERWEERSSGDRCRRGSGGTEAAAASGPAAAPRPPGGAGSAAQPPHDALPFTGFPASLLAVIGLALATIGAAMRRRARRPPG